MATNSKNTAKKPGPGLAGKWILIGLAALVIGAGGGALSLYLKNRKAAPARKSGAALIQTSNDITVSGKIRPQHIVGVKPEMDGDLDSFVVDVGQEVFEGQTLARIGASGLETARAVAEAGLSAAQQQSSRAETAVSSARMESSRADADQQRSRMALERSRQNYEHQRTLFQAGAAARQIYDRAQKDYDAARADLDIRDKASRTAAENLQATLNTLSAAQQLVVQRTEELDAAQGHMQSAEVRSPVDGLVVARSGEVGKPVVGELFSIATDLFVMEVVLTPDAQILNRLRPMQPALVIILDLQSAGLPGRIKEIKDHEVIVEFENTLPALKPDMLADVRFKMD